MFMTIKVLTGTYTAGYYLHAPITTLRIAARGEVDGGGITSPADAAVSYSVVNLGRVVNTDVNGAGIDLTHGGFVSNRGPAGTRGGAGGYIYGGRGVLIQGAEGSVANFGTIVGSASSTDGAGVFLAAGGMVKNGSTADLTATIAGYHGVKIVGAAGTLENFGTIQSLAKSSVYFGDGGVIRNGGLNDTTALISGGATGTGVSMNGAIGTVMNFGTIVSGTSGAGVLLTGGGILVNGAVDDRSAYIHGRGSLGVYASYATIRNFGTIAVDRDGAGYIAVFTYSGSVINGSAADTTALIKGYSGVYLYGASGALTNFGTIFGDYRGIRMYSSDNILVNGSAVDTAALISSRNNSAINASGPSIISNYGTIFSGNSSNDFRGAAIVGYGGAAVKNGNAADTTALIEGYTGVRLYGAGVLTNFGTISGDGTGAAGATAGVYVSGGVVTNGSTKDTTARIEGADGILSGFASTTVRNFGAIEGGAGAINLAGIMAKDQLTLTNGDRAHPDATIQGYTGIHLQGVGEVTNFGTIRGAGTGQFGAGEGVYLYNGGTVTNGAKGDPQALIAGASGIEARASTTVANFGTILGDGPGVEYGIALGQGGTVINGASDDTTALIEGHVGVFLIGPGTVTNFGTIKGNLAGGGNGLSIQFGTLGGDTSADRLIAEAGSVFVGAARVGQGAVNIVGDARFTGGLQTGGEVSGRGALILTGGITQFLAGATLTVTGVALMGPATAVDVEEDLTYAGTWAQKAGTLSVAAGDRMTFVGPADSFAGTLAGAGTVAFARGADTLDGTRLTVADVVIQGATVTLQGRIASATTVEVTTANLMIGAGGATLVGGTWALSDRASNRVMGVFAGATLQNIGATISGAGMLGGGQMTLINRAAGTIVGDGTHALVLDTGANAIVNFGLIEATGSGGVTIQSAVRSVGVLKADSGTLTVNGAVTGQGNGMIVSGALMFNAAFEENVTFGGTSGVLGLARSQTYAGAITGFSHTGGTSLDLEDIAFVNSGQAIFSGTTTSGVLTVSDGTHTARITLIGDYTSSIFVAGTDGRGGVTIVDTTKAGNGSAPAAVSTPSSHLFIAAMARLGDSAGVLIHADGPRPIGQCPLARPHAMIA